MHEVHSTSNAFPLPVELRQPGAGDLVVGRVRDRLPVTSSLCRKLLTSGQLQRTSLCVVSRRGSAKENK